MPLSNTKILEEICKFTEESSIADDNKVTVDTFSHISNTQRENGNAIFTSEKLDKSDELADTVQNLKTNNTKYYESNIATASDAQGDFTRNPETVTHTSNGNETATHTSNGDFEDKSLSNQTIPIVVPTTNENIDQRIEPIVLVPQMLLTLAMKEFVADTASGGEWVNRTPQQAILKGVDGSTPGNNRNVVRVKMLPPHS